MKKIIIIVLTVIIALFLIGIAKDQVIKAVITVAATQISGAPVHINGFSLGLTNQSVRISGLKIYNPPGFSKGILVDIPKIKVVCDLGGLLQKKIHLSNVDFELKEMILEKNKKGELNVDALKVAQKQEGKPGQPQAQQQMPLQIDELKLKMGRVVSKGYGAAGEQTISVYDINLDKSYKNITSAQQLAALIISEPMKSAGIQGAKVYGAAALAGAAILPVAVIATIAGRDSVEQDFNVNFDRLYDTSLKIVQEMGKVSGENKQTGVISATVNTASVTLELKKISAGKSHMTISARKYLFPRPEIALGVMYQISEKLK